MTTIEILLLLLCVDGACAVGCFFAFLRAFKSRHIHAAPAYEKLSGHEPDEPQKTEEQERAEQAMLDGINNILSYDLTAAKGGEDK